MDRDSRVISSPPLTSAVSARNRRQFTFHFPTLPALQPIHYCVQVFLSRRGIGALEGWVGAFYDAVRC